MDYAIALSSIFVCRSYTRNTDLMNYQFVVTPYFGQIGLNNIHEEIKGVFKEISYINVKALII